MDVLIISLSPVAIIAGYIWIRDKYEREPLRMLLLALLAGILIVFPVLAVEGIISSVGEALDGIASAAWRAFAVASFTEESFKYIVLFLLIWKSREFNDKYDGIVYSTYIALGFAGVENFLYVMQEGYATGMVRAFTAVPAHAIFGIIMGFYFGLAKFYPKKRSSMKLKALFIPMFLHGIYDFILMTGIEWLWIVFLAFLIFLYIMGIRYMKNFADLSYFKTDFDLLNKKFTHNDSNP
jgi:protease PrsW